jgi:hypothetical protein
MVTLGRWRIAMVLALSTLSGATGTPAESGSGAGLELGPVIAVAGRGSSPDVAISGRGEFTVVWTVRSAYARHFEASGEPFGEPMLLSAEEGQFSPTPKIAGNEVGQMVAVWSANENEGKGAAQRGIHARLLQSFQPVDGAPIVVSSPKTEHQGQSPAVGVDALGRFAVAWFTEEGIRARLFESDGSPLGASFLVSASPQARFPAIGMDRAGRFLVIWTTNDGGQLVAGVQARLFDMSGEALGPEIRVNTFEGQQGRGTVTVDSSGTFTVAWPGEGAAGRGTYLRQIGPDGLPLSEPVRIAPSTPPSTPPRPGETGGVPSVTAAPAGLLMAVWMSRFPAGEPAGDFAIAGVAFDPTRAWLGQETRLDDGGFGEHRAPELAVNAGGDLAVVWSSGGIRARLGRLSPP